MTRRLPLAANAIMLAAGGVLLLRPLARFWSENDNYAYGWGVPLLAAFLFYERWRCRPVPAPTVARRGLVPVALAWGACCLAVRLVLETEPASRPLLWLAAALWTGAVLAWVGLLGGRPWLRHFAFPVLFLLAGVPWIFRCEFLLVQELMRLNALAVAGVLRLAGFSAHAAGNTIALPTGRLGVSEACSGIRSLQATLMMALFFGEFYRFGWRGRAGLLAAGAALALAGNFVRMAWLARCGAVEGVAAVEAAHDTAGWTLLVLTVTGLWLVCLGTRSQVLCVDIAWLCGNFEFRPPEQGKPERKSPRVAGIGPMPEPHQRRNRPGNDRKAFRALRSLRGRADPGYRPSAGKCHSRSFPPGTIVSPTLATATRRAAQVWAASIFAATLAAEAATQAWYGWRESSAPHYPEWSVAWPAGAADFHSGPLPEAERRQLHAADASEASWRDGRGWRWEGLWIRYRAGAEGKIVFESHNPGLCLPAAGWHPLPDGDAFALRAQGVTLAVHAQSFATSDGTAHVFWVPYLDGGVRAGADEARGVYGHTLAALAVGRLPWLEDVWRGCRGVDAETLEVAVTGPGDLAGAEEAFREIAPGWIRRADGEPTGLAVGR